MLRIEYSNILMFRILFSFGEMCLDPEYVKSLLESPKFPIGSINEASEREKKGGVRKALIG